MPLRRANHGGKLCIAARHPAPLVEPRMPSSPVDAWHRIVDARSPAGLHALLAPDVVFHSPVMHTPQHGRARVTLYLTAALDVLCNGSFRYAREIVGPKDAALEFEAEIDGIVVNGVDLVRWNDAGEITDFKVMLRPLKAVHLVHQRMAAMLAAYAAATELPDAAAPPPPPIQ